MILCRTRRRLNIANMRSHLNVMLTVLTMIEILGVILKILTEDANALDQEIVEDPEREIMVVEQVVIEEIGEIILLEDEILTEPTDLEEITGTMISAMIDVGIIRIPIRTMISTLVTIKINIRRTIMYQTRTRRNLNAVHSQTAPVVDTPKINPRRFHVLFSLIDTNEILLK